MHKPVKLLKYNQQTFSFGPNPIKFPKSRRNPRKIQHKAENTQVHCSWWREMAQADTPIGPPKRGHVQ